MKFQTAYLISYEYGTGNLEEGRQDAGLEYREHPGADARPEAVGDVVGADAERQDERYYKAGHYYPD